MEKKKELVISVIGVFLLFIVVIGISYAVWSKTFIGTQENSINTGYVSFSYTESDTNVIEIHNAVPIADDNGKILSGNEEMFDFSVSANFAGVTSIDYEIYATPIIQTIDSEYIKVYLTDQNDNPVGIYADEPVPTYNLLEDSNVEDSKTIYKSSLTKSGEVANYRLRIWVASNFNVPDESQKFAFKVNVEGVA